MALKRIPASDFTPDIPLTSLVGGNIIAMPNGYRPAKNFSQVTVALPGIIAGASFIGSDGSTAILGGTASALYSYGGGAWASEIGGRTAASWRFDQFGDTVIAVDGGAPIAYDLILGTAALLGGSPPISSIVATVRQQVFLAGDPSARDTVSISGYNDSTIWTPGTQQSLNVPFPNGGEIMGIAGGETAVILQRRAVKRATYTGDVTVWQFDEISHDIGCLAKGSIAQAGQLVFFLADQGFMVCDRNSVFPIGNELVDRTFFNAYSRDDIVDKITAAIDPRATTVCWSMPGNPGRLFSYNWTIKKWSPPIQLPMKGVFSGFTSSLALEELDALFPSGLETIPVSLDSTMFAGGHPSLFVISLDDRVGTLTGDNLAAFLIAPPIEIEPGKRVRISAARTVGDITAGTVTLDSRARAGDGPHPVVSGEIRTNGRVPIRANGRHIGIRVDIPAGHAWSFLLGVDLDYAVEGDR